MYIDAVVVKGEGKSFSVQINTVKDGATTNLTAIILRTTLPLDTVIIETT